MCRVQSAGAPWMQRQLKGFYVQQCADELKNSCKENFLTFHLQLPRCNLYCIYFNGHYQRYFSFCETPKKEKHAVFHFFRKEKDANVSFHSKTSQI
jgi:hypothetical protein